MLRVKNLLNRVYAQNSNNENIVQYGDYRLDFDKRVVTLNDVNLNLTAKEFDLLELLMLHPNKVYSREELLNTVWGYDYPGDSRTVDVHIKRLREKISGGINWQIETVWGVGYKFEVK